MQKTKAIELLGGSTAAAAEAIKITYQAVSQWPDVLPARIADRVHAAWARKSGALPEPVPPQPQSAQPAVSSRSYSYKKRSNQAQAAANEGVDP